MRGDYHLNEAEIAYWRPLLEEKIKEICEQVEKVIARRK